MKKVLSSIILFIVGFAAAYLVICYWPGMRIKLAAEPLEYFVASIKHNMGFKILISSVCGLLICFIPLMFAKRAK